MRILHAALDGDALLLWADTSFETNRASGDAHPFAADHSALRLALVELGVANSVGKQATVWAHLPTQGIPLPSSPLLEPGREADKGAATELRPWKISALRVAGRDVPDLLRRIPARTAQLGHGLVAGDTLRAVAALCQAADGLVTRHRYLPTVRFVEGRAYARWAAVPEAGDPDIVHTLVEVLPPASVSLTPADISPYAVTPALVQGWLDRLVDISVRTAAGSELASDAPPASVHDAWFSALTAPDAAIVWNSEAELRDLHTQVEAWSERARRRSQAPFRLCFQLEEPDDVMDPDSEVAVGERTFSVGPVWNLHYLVQARDEPSTLVPLSQAWLPTSATADVLQKRGFDAREHVLAPLGEAAVYDEYIASSLRTAQPAGVELDTQQAFGFLSESMPRLLAAGFGVLVPSWWRGRGSRFQPNLRAQLKTRLTGGRQGLASLDLDALVSYDWRLALGDVVLSRAELSSLAKQKAHLVQVRGLWTEIDPAEVQQALDYMQRLMQRREGAGRTPMTDEMGEEGALSATIGDLVGMWVGAPEYDGLRVGGVDGGDEISALLSGLERHDVPFDVPTPNGFVGTLRDYQLRGLAWLACMGRLGLGACLADDMGLGKTAQALAALQYDVEQRGAGAALVVCPTSVVTNWQREIERFTPERNVLVHHGPKRLRGDEFLDALDDAPIVLTTYALLARDQELLSRGTWSALVLDEAQNIKNPGTEAARAARAIPATTKIALTGTPVENHVGDLWSIMEFLNPKLLGTQVDFRRKYMLPIQTGTFPEAEERLRRIVGPFVMRRSKDDPDIVPELPAKIESRHECTLTAEQLALYEAVVRDTEAILHGERPVGVQRSGAILAALSKLKQICNHPAQFVGDRSTLDGRSGKLERLSMLLDEVIEVGDRSLVFTQFAQMGELLQQYLTDEFGREILFLHGGTSRAKRDRIVERFQSSSGDAPPVLVLSLKAGGSGLNLTAASHVFHYDRWWNPAVEQQATDRTHRIGQNRTVNVHTLVCVGTVEERIDQMIERKRSVAEKIVGSGEQWISELEDDELLELIRVREHSLLQVGRIDNATIAWKKRIRS